MAAEYTVARCTEGALPFCPKIRRRFARQKGQRSQRRRSERQRALRIFPSFSRPGKCDSRGGKPPRTKVLWLSHGTFHYLLRKSGQVSNRSESEHRRCVVPMSLRVVAGSMQKVPWLRTPGNFLFYFRYGDRHSRS